VGDTWLPLPELIDRDGERILGSGSRKLPFLFKVLAAARPLSIQAHPDAAQALQGYAREEALGVAQDSPHRNYPDPSAKPEILYALTPFTMLRGFRSPSSILELLSESGLAGELPHSRLLRDDGAGEAETLRAFLQAHLLWPDGQEAQPAIMQCLRQAVAGGGDSAGLAAQALVLAEEYPADAGVLSPYFLHLLTLEPGEAIHTGAGILHAYLEGVGMELMANSDNVLRGGLTSKHVDVDELLRVLRFAAEPPSLLRPQHSGGEGQWNSPGRDLRLSVLAPSPDSPLRLACRGAVEILFCSEGQGELHAESTGQRESPALTFQRGDAFLVPAVFKSYRVAGQGKLFRARSGNSD
jgi:mannose-6-phosphate isomerase